MICTSRSLTYTNSYPPILSNTKRSRSISSYDEDQEYSAAGSAPPSPPIEPAAASSATTTKRRRREMQAISTIIETKEFPYNDDYLWKNNGNTVHKKTGFKSIYYKCSNSAKVSFILQRHQCSILNTYHI